MLKRTLLRLLRAMSKIPRRVIIAMSPILRFIAAAFLLLAVVMFAVGMTQDGIHTSTAMHWQQASPSSFEALKTTVSQSIGSWVWDPVLKGLLGLPAYMLFGLLALMCGLAGRRRRAINVFIN